MRAPSDAAKQFCAQIEPLLEKFPFNPQSPNEASVDEVVKVFAPGTGSFARYYNTSLKALVVPQSSEFYCAEGSKSPVSQTFLRFLNDAQKISSTLFSVGGNQPSLDFTLTEVKSPGIPDAVLTIDDQQITVAGQKVSFHWVSKPDGRYSLSSQGNASASSPGPWSVFHFGFAATHISPERLKYGLQLNNQTNGVVQFDISGPGASLLNQDFMKGFHCVSSLFR